MSSYCGNVGGSNHNVGISASMILVLFILLVIILRAW